MQLLKQSTAITLRFGPFLDETDGKTAEDGLTISQADIRLSKAGGDFAQSNDSSGATHDENGWYYLQLDATDTGTLGMLTVAIHESGALPVWKDFMVLPANTFDSLVSGSDYLTVDAVQVEGSDATDQINAACDTALSDYDAVVPADLPTNFADLSITASTGRVDVASIEGSDATDQIRDAVVDDSTRIDASALNTLSGHDPGSQLAAQSDVTGLNDPTAAAIADAVWDEDIVAAHNTADTAGALLDDLGTPADFKADVSALAVEANVETHVTNSLNTYDPPTKAELDSAHSTTDGLITTVDTVVDGIKAVTDNLPDSGALTSLATASALATVDGNVDAILADTGTDGVVLADGAITAAKIATDAIGADEIAAAGANKIADHVLKRNMATSRASGDGDGTGRFILQAFSFLRNKKSQSGGTLTVTQEDDSTPDWTAAITTDAEAVPITALDPS